MQPLTPHVWWHLGPYGVGNLACSGDEIAWTTGTRPLTKLNSRNDVVELMGGADREPKVVATARHGGDLTSGVPMSWPWLVYLEYRQHLGSDRADFWYLDAVNLTNGGQIELARATDGAPLRELPWYDAGNGYAVWNQLDQSGREFLGIHNFSTGASSKLPLPRAMSPVEPTISGNAVVFVDNSTDPDQSHEDFFGHRGTLRRFELLSKKLVTLNANPTAWMPEARGGTVIWTVMEPTSGIVSEAVAEIPLQGGKTRILGGREPVTPQTDGSIVVWYDAATRHFMLFSHGRLVRLHVGEWSDVRSVFALCGRRLFFALPLTTDGGSSTIRFVDLPRSA